MGFNFGNVVNNATNFLNNTASTIGGGLSNLTGNSYYSESAKRANEERNRKNEEAQARLNAQRAEEERKAAEKARQEAFNKALESTVASSVGLASNALSDIGKGNMPNQEDIAKQASLIGQDFGNKVKSTLSDNWNQKAQEENLYKNQVKSSMNKIFNNDENKLVGNFDQGKNFANNYQYNDFGGTVDPWGIGESNYSNLYANSDKDTQKDLFKNKAESALASAALLAGGAAAIPFAPTASIAPTAIANGEILSGILEPLTAGGGAALASSQGQNLMTQGANLFSKASETVPEGLFNFMKQLPSGTIPEVAESQFVRALPGEVSNPTYLNELLRTIGYATPISTGILAAANIDQNEENKKRKENNSKFFGSMLNNKFLMDQNNRFDVWDWANNLSPEQRQENFLAKLNDYYSDDNGVKKISDAFGNVFMNAAMAVDPDIAIENPFGIYDLLQNTSRNFYTNKGQNMDSPWLTEQFANNEDTNNQWMTLIDTNAAPKQYDQMDRTNYFIMNTPYGWEWINEALDNPFDGVSKEDLKNDKTLDNAFTKWRLGVLDNTLNDRTGSMSNTVDILGKDLFEDATGIKLNRGPNGKLDTQSKNDVDKWALTDDNIFYLDRFLTDPDYINDPTFLNWGFDANAIADLTQLLMKNGVILYSIDPERAQLEGVDTSKLNADDLAQYITTALLQRQNNGTGTITNKPQTIGLNALNAIFNTAGDKTLTYNPAYGNKIENLLPLDLINPGPTDDKRWYGTYTNDQNGNPIDNPIISDRFVDTVLAHNPDLLVYNPELYKAKKEAEPKVGFTKSEYDDSVNLINPMWW